MNEGQIIIVTGTAFCNGAETANVLRNQGTKMVGGDRNETDNCAWSPCAICSGAPAIGFLQTMGHGANTLFGFQQLEIYPYGPVAA